MSRKGQSRSSWVPVVSFNRAVHSRQQTDPGLRARTGMPIISSGLAKPASFTTAGLPLMAFPCRWTTTTSKMESRSSWYCCRAPRHPWTARRDFPHPASRCTCRVLPREGLDDRRKVWRMGGQANSQAKADGPAQTASARQFDCSRTQAERRAATMRLLARLKAIDSRQEARSARLCQRLCPETRTAEPAIVRGWRRNRGDPG